MAEQSEERGRFVPCGTHLPVTLVMETFERRCCEKVLCLHCTRMKDDHAEIARLREENTRLRGELAKPQCQTFDLCTGAQCTLREHDGYVSHVMGETPMVLEMMGREIAVAKQDRDAARADSERLNWLESNAEPDGFGYGDEGKWRLTVLGEDGKYHYYESDSLHTAIDTAREQEGKDGDR